MNIIIKVKQFVEDECKKPSSKYGYEPYTYHFKPMVKYALKLADELGGDKEIIEIAAWLHDIGSIVEGRKNHHISGVKISENKLLELNYPKEKIELVNKCILNHRSSKNLKRSSIEEQIIAEADAMSNFDNLAGIFKAAFIYEHLDQKEAQNSVRKKLENKWNNLHFKQSKELLKNKYEAAMLILGDEKEILIETRESPIEIATMVNETIIEFDEPYTIDHFQKRYKDKDHLIIASYINNQPVGYMISYDRFNDGSIYCWMTGVNPVYRRKGVLKNMMAYLEKWAKSKGYSKISVKTRNQRREMLAYLIKSEFYLKEIETGDNIKDNRILFERKI